ncbi:MAG: DNA internalization-related competence protein ComEC/Rec2 [Thermodesulfobacteriota bacterium]|nr:DNA internalization-related competence protein ComEC/Rec2 [Thermodesulfobacteriota bacterium]
MTNKPLIPLLISFIAGLLLCNSLYLAYIPAFILTAVMIFICFFAITMDWKGIGTVLFPVIFILIGTILMNQYTRPQLPFNHISNLMEDKTLNIQGTLYSPPQLQKDRLKLYIKAERLYSNQDYINVTGKLILTVSDTKTDLKYGDRIRFISRLRSPRNFYNPGSFDYSKYLAYKGIFAIGHLKDCSYIVRIGEGDTNCLWKAVQRYRGRIRDFIDNEVELPNRAIIKALILGEKGEIPDRIKDNFIDSGVAHILAISGLHLGFIAMVSFFFTRWMLKFSERLMLSYDINKIAAIVTVFPLFLYAFVSGFGVSTFRATIMIMTFLIAIVIDRQRDMYNTLALAAFIILVISPSAIFDVSFQLSFASVLAILYLVPRLLSYFSWIRPLSCKFYPYLTEVVSKYIGLLVLVSIAATLGTVPIAAYYFHRVAPFGFISNIAVVPIVGFIVIPIGLLIAVMVFVFPSLAALLIDLESAIIGFVVYIVKIFPHIPFSSFWVSTPSLIETSLFYLFIGFLFNTKRHKAPRYIAAVLVVFILANFLYWSHTNSFNSDLHVTFLSVGQGDCAVIELPKGKRMIIDGGGFNNSSYDTGKNIIAPFLYKEKIKRIDYLVLSHPHPDHLGGLCFIAKNFKVKEIWTNGQRADFESYDELTKIIDDKGIKEVVMNIETGSHEISGVRVDIYHPQVALFNGKGSQLHSSMNNNSLVVKLTYKNISFLFTGDIEEEAERKLATLGSQLRSTVIKVPHHGSTTSSTKDFLSAVRPSYAVFSVGYKNRFGFPKKAVIERYKDLDCKTYRTDTQGAITMITDGEVIQVNRALYD